MRGVRATSQGVIDSASIFERDRYVVLCSVLKEPKLTQFYRHALNRARSGGTVSGDDQVPGTPSFYGDLIMDGLLSALLPEIEEASGLKLFPTYSYFRVYKRGDRLAKHVDRPSCEISVSLCLGFEEGESWPIWIEAPSVATSVILNPGDALLYRGMECPHWREVLEGDRQAQIFLHYVNQNGPCAAWKFDKGRSTAGLQSITPGLKPQRGLKKSFGNCHSGDRTRSDISATPTPLAVTAQLPAWIFLQAFRSASLGTYLRR